MRGLCLRPSLSVLVVLLVLPFVAACQPTVRIETPTEPIVINLNIKIEQEVRIRVEQDIDDLLSDDAELF